MATQGGWLRGVVKEVPSGDSLIIMGAVKSGIPPEKRITLSSVMAPKLGRRDGSTRDEPFAWEAREFLRKLCIGKPCVFRIEYALEQLGGREFGSVFINEKDNLATAVIAAGMAKVRPAGGQQSPFYDDLVKAQDAAEAKSLGIHTKDRDAASAAVRDTPHADEFDAAGLVQRVGKGRPINAIIDGVMTGSTVRVTLLPGLESATVMVAGVQCPSMGRRQHTDDAGGATTTQEAPQPEPFAREAKHYTEVRTLNRDCRLILEGVSQFGVLIARVEYPVVAPTTPTPDASNKEEAAAFEDLGMGLVKNGLGKAVEWSLNMMSSGAFKLRETERTARQSKVGAWHNYVPAVTNNAKLSDAFTGVVSEVVSGDIIVIRDKSNNVERRVCLSSIRAPRPAARDRAAETWGTEAKEFLRQRLIGKEVNVRMEYDRKIPAAVGGGGGSAEERVMAFGTVTVQEKGEGGEVKLNNVAELLLVRGLAQVVKHRADEERSAHYEALMNAEESGKRSKKGQWSSKEPPTPRVNDLSLPGSSTRAKQHLPFLQRAGKVHGVCEHIMGGSRVKIHIPKESVTIAFSPSGVRCPTRGQPASGGRPATAAEPYGDEAFNFTREHVLQRDVEVEIESVDKAGTFLGSLKVPGQRNMNLGVALLEHGFARLHPSFDAARFTGGGALAAAQDKARQTKLKVWEKDEGSNAAAHTDDADAVNGDGGVATTGTVNGTTTSSVGKRDHVEVVITEVVDANTFYVQVQAGARANWLAEQLSGLQLDTTTAPTAPLKNGDKCLARFDADKQWYRAVVEKANLSDPTAPVYDVYFIDFGNRERVVASSVRACPPDLAAVAAQAQPASLAFVKPPGLDQDYGVEAAQMVSELVGGGRRLAAVVEKKERLSSGPVKSNASAGGGGKSWGAIAASSSSSTANTGPMQLSLTLYTSSSEEGETVNKAVVAAGFARVAEPNKGEVSRMDSGAVEVLESLRSVEEGARTGHVGMWRYGDPGEDDEDDVGFPALGGGKRGGRR